MVGFFTALIISQVIYEYCEYVLGNVGLEEEENGFETGGRKSTIHFMLIILSDSRNCKKDIQVLVTYVKEHSENKWS